MNIAAMWLGLPKWVRDAIMIFGAILAVIFLGKQYVKAKQAEAVHKNNEEHQREALKEQARVDQTRREISEENQDAIRRADEAVRDLPGYRATDELRNNDPGNAAIVLGTGARHSE